MNKYPTFTLWSPSSVPTWIYVTIETGENDCFKYFHAQRSHFDAESIELNKANTHVHEFKTHNVISPICKLSTHTVRGGSRNLGRGGAQP